MFITFSSANDASDADASASVARGRRAPRPFGPWRQVLLEGRHQLIDVFENEGGLGQWHV